MAFLNKSIVKILIAILFVLFLIFASPNDSQAVMIANTRMTDDIWSACRNQMDDNLLSIYSNIRMYYKNNMLSDNDLTRLRNMIVDMQKYHYFIDTYIETQGNNNYLCYRIYFYYGTYNSFSYSNDTLYIYYDDNSTQDIERYGVGVYTLDVFKYLNIRPYKFAIDYPNLSKVYYGNAISNFGIWSPYYQYKGNHVFLSNLINGIENDFIVDPSSDFALLSEIAKNTKDSSDSTRELTDFVKNDSIDSSSSDFNTDSGISDNSLNVGVGNIFQQIYNTIQNWGSINFLTFPFPNTNYNISLSAVSLRARLISNGGQALVSIIQGFWLFIVGRFIVKDVLNYYEKLKSGDIVKSSETNIKADML